MPENDNPASEANALLSLAGTATARFRRAVVAYYATKSAYTTLRTLTTKAVAELAHTVTVSSDDELFNEAQDWLLEKLPPTRRRALKAISSGGSGYGFDDDAPDHNVRLVLDGRRRSILTRIEGHPVRVAFERDNIDGEYWEERRITRPKDSIVFTAKDIAGREAVVRLLEGLAEKRQERDPRLFIAQRWGEWNRRSSLKLRGLDTVVLADGIAEFLIEDLGNFLDREDHYDRLGIPWHHGYVFHGPPGTGKTSLAKAIASHFGMDLYYVPLSDLEKDANLINLFSQIPPCSILLLEDIDIVHAATERDDAESKGISMSALLNGLDGVITPHGLVTIMTTNDLDELDEALVRPGRADEKIELGYVQPEQMGRLIEALTGIDPGVLPDIEGLEITPADIVKVLKQHITDPIAGVRAVKMYLSERGREEGKKVTAA